MATQYMIAGVLILAGTVTAWIGPEYGVREDGTPLPPKERPWVRMFGTGVAICGAVVLVAPLLGFRGQPLDDRGVP